MNEDVQDPNKNDRIFESELVRVEFDKNCWGPNRWVVFARPNPQSHWRLVAECPTSEEALEIAKDPERTESGDMALTVVERLRKNAIQQAKDAAAVVAHTPKLKAKK